MTGNRVKVASGQDDDRPNRTAGQALVALRAATRLLHAQVDAAMPLAMEGRHTLVDYAAHLQLMQRWLSPFRPWFSDVDDECMGYSDVVHAQLSAIALDLAEIASPVPQPLAQCQGNRLFGADAGTAYRWGVAYVIEGSRLGAAALHAHLRPMLQPHPLRYLRGEGESRAGRWREFLSTLEVQVRTPVQIADCCSGARAAFDAMLQVLDKDSGRVAIEDAA